MFDLLKLRMRHGKQAIPDVANATPPEGFRGRPVLVEDRCVDGCRACEEICPTGAIRRSPLRLDMGACIFCADCVRECPTQAISLSHDHRLGTTRRNELIVGSQFSGNAASGTAVVDTDRIASDARRTVRRLYGRSFRLRHVSAGSCNGCELELGAAGNVNFDIARFGIEFVASPRHADGLVITGAVNRNMVRSLEDAYQSVPGASASGLDGAKVVIAVGACAISGGLFAGSPETVGSGAINIDLYIPGCPPHPLAFIRAVLDFLGRR